MTRLLRDMLLLLALAASLWVIHLYGRMLGSEALLVIWLLLAAIIAGGLVWRRRIRRRGFLAVYIAPASPLQRLLRGGLLMVIAQGLIALALALVLLVALVRTGERFVWVVLILAAPLLPLLRALVRRRFAAHVSSLYLPEFSLRLAVPWLGVPLLAVLVYAAMQRSYPDFTAVTLDRAAWHLVEQEHARSEVLLVLLQIAAASEALRLWLAQQLLPALGLPLFQWLGWLLVFVRETLFVWSYLLLCQGLLLGVSRDARS